MFLGTVVIITVGVVTGRDGDSVNGTARVDAGTTGRGGAGFTVARLC